MYSSSNILRLGREGGGLAPRTLPQGDEAERSRNAKLFEIGGFVEGSSIQFKHLEAGGVAGRRHCCKEANGGCIEDVALRMLP